MIPHRMLNNEISDNGLRDRVSACRKRLRVSRVTHKPHALDEADELFPESIPLVSEFLSYTTDLAATPASITSMNCSKGYEGSEPKDGGAAVLVEGQEVGIT